MQPKANLKIVDITQTVKLQNGFFWRRDSFVYVIYSLRECHYLNGTLALITMGKRHPKHLSLSEHQGKHNAEYASFLFSFKTQHTFPLT